MSKRSPSIIVSSTFYDLKDIRADLANFLLNDLGYVPLLSELSSFPVDPDSDTVENCKRRVENDADLMILVIGGRYGYVDKASARSITNIEYLAARAKGIPVFAFVHKGILPLFTIWQTNKTADFSAAVDDPRLFEFLETVRIVDKVWMFEFEGVKDIIQTLRSQFAYLMYEGLKLSSIYSNSTIPKDPNLSGTSIKYYLEKPKFWEYFLFSQSLIDQINSRSDLKREYELSLVIGQREQVTIDNFSDWFGAKVSDLLLIIEAVTKLLPGAVDSAFGPPGQPGDAEAILFVTKKLAAIYEEALEWSLRVKRAAFADNILVLQSQMSDFSQVIIDEIPAVGTKMKQSLEDFLALPEPREHKKIEIMVSFTIPNVDTFLNVIRSTYASIYGCRN